MISLSLGPLALPATPLLLLAATIVAAQVARRLTPRAAAMQATDDASPPAPHAGSVVVQAVGMALLVARFAHLAVNWDAYRAEPAALFDLRDGGWHFPSGIVAGLVWVAWQARRRTAWRRALAAGAAAGLALWSAGLATMAALTPRDLPELALTDLASGQPVRLRELAGGRPVVVNLWASWCGPCRREMPMMMAAQQRHPDVAFVFVNQGEAAAAVRRYLDANRLVLEHVVLDRDAALGPALGSGGLPTTVVFDRHGRRTAAHMGLLNGPALATMLGEATAR